MTTKAAIVTGGAQGIGKAIAGTLLTNGYKVRFLKFVSNQRIFDSSRISGRENLFHFTDFSDFSIHI